MAFDDKIRDRRANARIPVRFPAELSDLSYSWKTTVTDLSPGGVRLELKSPPPSGTDVDLVLRPQGKPALKFKGRVAHATEAWAGIAFNVGKPEAFEAALDLYETLVFADPAQAIRLKQRPTRIALTAKLYSLPPRGRTMSGPEHWVYSQLKPHGTLVSELQRALGPEWQRMSHLPFVLIDRGLASLTQPRPEDLEPEPPSAPVPVVRGR